MPGCVPGNRTVSSGNYAADSVERLSMMQAVANLSQFDIYCMQ